MELMTDVGASEASAPNVEKQLSQALEGQDVKDENDPFNWSVKSKWKVTLIACFVTLIVGFNATAITSAAVEINERFDVSDEHFSHSFWPVTSWAVGAALAPMIVLPIMEDFGMRIGYLVTYILFVVFVIPQAIAQNFSTLIVCRFIAGCCGGVLQDAMDGIIADIWSGPTERSLPVTFYVFSLLLGVTFGPVLGGAVVGSLHWRWMFYIQLIIYGASLPLICLTFKETRGLVILSNRLKRSHKVAQPDLNGISRAAERSSITLKDLLYSNIGRSFYLLCTEPVVFFFTLLSALSYGLVFMSTQSVTQVYISTYAWEEYQAGLVQLSLIVGEFLGFLTCIVQNRLFARASAKATTEQAKLRLPEVRLYGSILGSFFGLAGGLFWYGWTSFPFLHWVLPSIGLGMIGFGSMVVMQAIMMYITDAYAKFAASASAAVCFGENLFAAFLPLAATRMYTDLGFQWASSLLAFIALLLSFAPVVLILKGKDIRRRSPFMKLAVYD